MAQLGKDSVGTFDPKDANPDQLEAAMERHDVMKKLAKENKQACFATKQEMNEVREEKSGSEDYGSEDEENNYRDLVETKTQDPNYVIPKVDVKTFKQVKEMEEKEKELDEKMKRMRPNDGVKMVEYNQWGIPKDGHDYSNFFREDEARPADIVLKPPPDYKYPAVTIDADKDVKELTEEEKEVHACLERDDVECKQEDMLEDDFVLKANGGLPALVDESAKQPEAKAAEKDDEWEDEDNGSEDGEEEDDDEKEEVKVEGKLTKEQLHKLLQEYLEKEAAGGNKGAKKAASKKAHKHADSDEDEEMSAEGVEEKDSKGKKPSEEMIQEPPEEKKKLIRTIAPQSHLQIEKIMELDQLAQAEEIAGKYDMQDEPEEPPKKTQWDIETIASTYNNTDNRPKVLDEEKKPLEARKLRRVHKSKAKETAADGAEQDKTEPKKPTSVAEMTKEEKAQHKREVKTLQREKRQMKKDTKQAFQVRIYGANYSCRSTSAQN